MRISPSRILATLTVVVSLGACQDASAPDVTDLSVSASPTGLVIVNTTAQPVHTLEMEGGMLALVDPRACEPTCSVQQPGTRRVVPWETILGYGPDRSDYLVYWFPVETLPDG